MEPFYECVHHLDNQHLRTYYDYVDILQNDTKAKIARLLEWVTNEAGTQWSRAMHIAVSNGEPMEPEPEFWVWLSHKWFLDQIVPRIHEDTLRKHLNEMEMDEWFYTRPHPDKRKRHLAPQYLFNSPRMQEAFEEREKRKREAIRKDGRRALSPYLDGIPPYDESKEYPHAASGKTHSKGAKSPTPSENIEGVGKGGGGRHRPGGKTPTPSENIEGVGKGTPPPKTPTRGVGNYQPGGYENTNQGGMKTPTRGVGNLLPRNKNLISNYSQESEIESSSSESREQNDASESETQEEGEGNLPLSENISANDDVEPTESRMPAVSKNGASSTIEDVTQVTSKQRIPPVIPHRPTGEKPGVQSAPAKQARCDVLAAKLKALRGYALENEATVREQAEAIRQLVTQYSNDELAWVLVYTLRLSEQYRGVKPGPKYASILLEVAPTALKAATPEVRVVLMQQQQSVLPAASIPPAAPTRQLQQPQPDDPYSIAAHLARQNGGRHE